MAKIRTITEVTTQIALFPEDKAKMAEAIFKVIDPIWGPNCPGPLQDIWKNAAHAAVDSLEFEDAKREK